LFYGLATGYTLIMQRRCSKLTCAMLALLMAIQAASVFAGIGAAAAGEPCAMMPCHSQAQNTPCHAYDPGCAGMQSCTSVPVALPSIHGMGFCAVAMELPAALPAPTIERALTPPLRPPSLAHR
jgi:hypothetical protein